MPLEFSCVECDGIFEKSSISNWEEELTCPHCGTVQTALEEKHAPLEKQQKDTVSRTTPWMWVRFLIGTILIGAGIGLNSLDPPFILFIITLPLILSGILLTLKSGKQYL